MKYASWLWVFGNGKCSKTPNIMKFRVSYSQSFMCLLSFLWLLIIVLVKSQATHYCELDIVLARLIWTLWIRKKGIVGSSKVYDLQYFGLVLLLLYCPFFSPSFLLPFCVPVWPWTLWWLELGYNQNINITYQVHSSKKIN